MLADMEKEEKANAEIEAKKKDEEAEEKRKQDAIDRHNKLLEEMMKDS